jgi:membrane protein
MVPAAPHPSESTTRTTDVADPHSSPTSPTDLTRATWRFTARASAREFLRDECPDLAAALTYYSVLALFPALIALLSVVGLVGRSDDVVRTVLDSVDRLGVDAATDTVRPAIEALAAESARPGLALVVGLATALWSASAYVGAFGRALNRIYEVEEGRPFVRRRLVQLAVTAGTVLLASVVLLGLLLSGPVAETIGGALGLGDVAVRVWDLAKLPVLLLAVVVIIALLYTWSPNVVQPSFRWVSVGAAFAIVVWVLATLIFGFYVSSVADYGSTYGALAGVIVLLVWLWLTNLALLFGAELDSELERGRELQSGIPAEEELQLPPRDDATLPKQERADDEHRGRARRLRQTRGGASS